MSHSSPNNDDFDFQRAANQASEIEKILKDYDKQGGSSKFSLRVVRDPFAKVQPYSESDFIVQFSVVARRAIELDRLGNHPIAEVGGSPPSRPTSPSSPLFILPARPNAPIGSNFSLPKNVEVSLPSITRATQNINSSAQAFGIPSFSFTQPGQSENILPPIRSFGQQPISSLKEKGVFRQEHLLSSSPSPIEPMQSSSKNPGKSNAGKRHISPPKHQKKAHRKTKHHHVSDSSDSTNSSSVSDENWGFKKGDFAESSIIHPTTPSAQRFANTVEGYNNNRKGAIKSFIAAGLKPGDFPRSLLPDLFKGSYIDLKKVAGELAAADKGEKKTLSIGNGSKGVEISSKLSTSVIADQAHWLHLFGTYVKVFSRAFPDSKNDMGAYAEYIHDQAFSNGRRANWICVDQFDAALRRAFADRPYLGLRDWNNAELDNLKTSHMSRAYDPILTQNLNAHFSSTHNRRQGTPSIRSRPQLPIQLSSKSNKFRIESGDGIQISEQHCNNWNADCCTFSDKDCVRLHTCNVKGCGAKHQGCHHA